uniref:Uncharacterized protein n=1 Tax=Noctiluca scintillans TaxID=2966 RepID=A0A7S1AKB5_NOCSC|eukprot:CAMPEP_0194521302 /NCGR_PEP_ID=MMETSP0253-20130528/55566_1 /TAXON_ID=2966 /ORGANISM="Noctiluca scintillans" /LENGTH=286 /DNA_ID=CAMNT_0039365647 /DNA_START=10 /DNA_END=870 /DNA_ORIENTATION=-
MAAVNPKSKPRTEAYTADEIAYRRFLHRLDLGVLPFFVLWYLGLASWMTGDAVADPATPAPPLWVLLFQGFLAAASLGTYAFEVQMPSPKKTDLIYVALRHIGWWVTLTRHCIAFQAVHFTLSFVGALAGLPQLVLMTHRMFRFIGTVGFFVTIQYFSLVHFNSEFVERCDRMSRMDPPVPLRRHNIYLHAPAIVFAILDATVARSGAAIQASGSVPASFVLCTFYVAFYLALISLNKKITGNWPYGMLEDLKTAREWAIFFVTQLSVFWLFCACTSGLALLPRLW